MSEQRQKEIKELLLKHTEKEKEKIPSVSVPSNITISDIKGSYNIIYINSYVNHIAKKS